MSSSKTNEILSENLLELNHINHIYHVFALMSELHCVDISPLDFRNFLSKQNEFKNLSLDKDLVDLMFMKMDQTKDGIITFEDFLFYIYSNIKLILSPINFGLDDNGENEGFIKFLYKMPSVNTKKEKSVFYSLIYNFLIRADNILE